MNRDQILSILYEMALVIGGEVRLRPLLSNTLQRLLFHTAFPCGLIVLWEEGRVPDRDASGMVHARLELSIGDLDLAAKNGSVIPLPAGLLSGGFELAESGELLSEVPCRRNYYRVHLRLPIDNCGVILLLAPQMPLTELPLTRVFQPVMGNFAKAIHLCRSSEAYTERLIADQRTAEAALKDMSYRHRLILDSVGEGIYGTDTDGTIAFANPAAANMLGFSVAELIHQNSHHLFHHTRTDGRPYPLEECPLHMALTGGVVHRSRDEVFWTKDGRKIDVEHVNTPLMEDNRIVGAVVVFRDITERKKTEEAARLASAYNRSLIEASLDPLVTIGPDGRITDVNSSTESVTGCSREKLIGTDFSDYFTEPDKARAGYQQVFREGMVRDYGLEIRHRDGHATPVLYNASIFRNEQGAIIGVFAAARDITLRKRMEETLRNINAELDQRVKDRTAELAAKNAELERMNKLFVGRELRMKELKDRIRELELQHDEHR